MTRRYYVRDLPAAGGLVNLPDEEARHASRVMRLQTGEQIELFDGQGREATAEVSSIDKRTCVVHCEAPREVDREPSRRLHLAVALPKPDRAKELIERLTELGVERLTPITCQRTQRPPSDALLAKLRRAVVESSKQCGRNKLLSVQSPVSIEDFLSDPPGDLRLIAHPNGRPFGWLVRELDPEATATVMVGPEGGFTDQEVASATESGFLKVSLGSRIYRIETAAVVAAALLVT